jgi:hypothetical protein
MSSLNAGIGVTALVAGAAIWIFQVGPTSKGGRFAPYLALLLVATGVSGLVGTRIGNALRSVVDWANRGATHVIADWTGAVVNGVLAGVAVYLLAMRIKANRIDNLTLSLSAIAPVAAATIPGPVGEATYSVVTGITGLAGQGIGRAFGLL